VSSTLRIGGGLVEPGTRARLEIPVARLPTQTWLSLPLEVVNGISEGPRLWISAAVHGDELNGVEIVRQVLGKVEPGKIRGALLAVPIVNVYGFINQSRYLPDRRDLNRSFPGSDTGSLASRLAHLFMTEVVRHCTHGIDLHTGSNHRSNLPQVRADLRDVETRRCAKAFAAPVMMHAQTRDGSLREAATRLGKQVLMYEAGEPLRFDMSAVSLGVRGILRVMAALGMRTRSSRKAVPPSTEVAKSTWVRARRSGILRVDVNLGDRVAKKQALGTITDVFGENAITVRAPIDGLIIGYTNNPLVNQGDGILHLARIVSDGAEDKIG